MFLFGGGPKIMCSSQNYGPFFVSEITILGVLFMRDFVEEAIELLL
jgi:hypothetical protein